MVSLGAQRSNSFSVHPLFLERSLRCVGFIRPGPVFGTMSSFGNNFFGVDLPTDFIGLEDGSVLGEEYYGDPMGIG